MTMRLTLVSLLLLVAGCGGSGAPSSTTLPAGRHLRSMAAPDVVLVSVSGRTFDVAIFCPPDCNEPYLADAGDAAEAVEFDLTSRGLSVEHLPFIAALENYDDDDDGEFDDRFGYLQLVADLEWIQQNWIDGAADPTRIVILAHSHGTVWAHIACSVLPQVSVEVLISLDGVCLQWADDHAASIGAYYANFGNPWSWDISAPCDRWSVPGVVDPQDTEDIVFDNVVAHLEVRSNGAFPFIRDEQINHRPDGTQDDIFRFDSSNDSHSEVHAPSRESMLWVLDRLIDLGF
jgi:hypothetical protein